MEANISTDADQVWQRLHNLVDWSLQQQADPRQRATEVVRSLMTNSGQAESDELRRLVEAELARQESRQVGLAELQRLSAWLCILNCAKAAVRAGSAKVAES